MSSINITIFGLIFILLLIFVYFSKKRINIIENVAYGYKRDFTSLFIFCFISIDLYFFLYESHPTNIKNIGT